MGLYGAGCAASFGAVATDGFGATHGCGAAHGYVCVGQRLGVVGVDGLDVAITLNA